MIVHGKISLEYPKGWKIDLLDKLSKRRTGHTPDKKHPEYYDDSFSWISLADSNILDNTYIDKTKFRISQLGLDNSSAVLLDEGTVVLSRDAGVGKSAIISRQMAVSQHFVTWTCGSLLNNYYLYCCLQEAKPLFERMAVGSTIKTIGLPFFRKLKIGYPSLPTQNRIAAILQTWDRAIQLAEQQLADLQERKQGLMQLLLTGKKRLPEFEGKEEWREVKLGEVASEYYERSKTIDLVLSCTKHDGLVPSLEYFGRRVYGDDTSKYKVVKNGDFAYATNHLEEGSIGRNHGLDGLVSPMYTVFTLDSNELLSDFYELLMKQDHLLHFYKTWTEGSVNRRGGLRWDGFSKIPIFLPTLSEQKSISNAIKKISRAVENAEPYLTSLRLQKRGLMQRLLEGEVEVGEEMDEILGL